MSEVEEQNIKKLVTNFQNIPTEDREKQATIKKIDFKDVVKGKYRFKFNFVIFRKAFLDLLTFTLLLFLYVAAQIFSKITSWKYYPKNRLIKLHTIFNNFYLKSVKVLDLHKEGSISRINLMDLAIRNMKAKRTRTVVTISGMALGVGTIVFLVSIGYGLQQMVVSRIARLDEMKQTDIVTQSGSKITINDKTVSSFKDIPEIDMVLPLIAVVGRVNYQNSVSDMAVYGVTTDYLKQSAIKPIEGKIFDSNELSYVLPVLPETVAASKPEVAGAFDEAKFAVYNKTIQQIDFTIHPDVWIKVRDKPDPTAAIIGYTRHAEGNYVGEEVWGKTYLSQNESGKAGKDEQGKDMGKWIKASVLLWKNEKCDKTNVDCEDGKYIVMRDDNNQQAQQTGYFAEVNTTTAGIIIKPVPQVLAASTTASDSALVASLSATVSSLASDSALITTSSADPNWVEIASEAGIIQPPEAKKVEIAAAAKKQAVVNRAMLRIINIKENEAIGKTFTVSFIVVGNLLDDPNEKIESIPTDYTIIGVIPDDKTPVFYVPFIDLRSLGIVNFSQIRAVAKNQNDLAKIRKQIEAMGYSTRSVADTVNQVNSLFTTAKAVLGLLGMVALAVAALGMFNTLTVSLLERTREVGLMKAMGMKSSEVQELFLTESMIMGLFGGLLGIVFGITAGKLVGVLLSLFAVFKGVGLIDISYVPLIFILVIIVLSLIVGITTGIYPAKRATKISALNALRYE